MSILNLKFLVIFLFFSCGGAINNSYTTTEDQDAESTAVINPTGEKLIHRITTPSGYSWERAMPNSFAAFLQNLPLKEAGSPVLDYTGTPISNQDDHIAVINYDVGNKNLQQCADATIRLRAEYLFQQKRFEEIGFHFTSGDYFSWTDYADGIRPIISGNSVSFSKTTNADNSYASFRKYLDVIYNYAGTISVNRETSPVHSNAAISSGDLIITPGSPGHAVMIVGVAKDKQNRKIFLLAESYMPAQSIHILKNPFEKSISPWYHLDLNAAPLQTARYTFNQANIRRFE